MFAFLIPIRQFPDRYAKGHLLRCAFFQMESPEGKELLNGLAVIGPSGLAAYTGLARKRVTSTVSAARREYEAHTGICQVTLFTISKQAKQREPPGSGFYPAVCEAARFWSYHCRDGR